MFNKIRNKYVLTNMFLIGSMITFAFGMIFYVSYQSTITSQVSKLDEQAILFDPHQQTENSIDFSIFHIIFDENGSIESKGGSMPIKAWFAESIQEKSKSDTKKYATVKLDDSIYVTKSYLKLDKYSHTTSQPVSFLLGIDTTSEINQLKNLFLVMSLLLLLVLGFVFIICVYLANKSVSQLREAWEKQRQFIGDASHELKTPIAIINSNVDALNIQTDNQWIQNIKSETKRMNILLTDLLYLTQVDDYNLEFTKENLDLSELVHEALLGNEVLMFEKGLSLEIDIQNHVMISGDEEKLKQLLHILFDNAIKYSHSEISVVLKEEYHTITFSVENDGRGINPENVSKVFDRFYKEEQSRVSSTTSYGLGLSIAYAIVTRMSGEIYVQSVVGEKTKFTVVFEV